MNCPYCGTEIAKGQVFCPKCGNRVVDHEITNTYEMSDTRDLELFIGPNVGKIMARRFSWASFFLGVYYYLYRKMYLLSLIFISIQLGSIYAFYKFGFYDFDYASGELPSNYMIFVLGALFVFVLQLLIAAKFNDIYINYASGRVHKIKEKGKNLTKYEMEEKIKCSGGVNLLIPVLFLLITNVFSFYLNGLANKIVDNISNNSYNIVTVTGGREYIELNEDKSFMWYKDVSNKDDNFYIGKYSISVGKRAAEKAKQHKVKIDNIIDINNFYFVKFEYNRIKTDGITSTVNATSYYYGVYKENTNSIDLNNVEELKYLHLEKIDKDQESS